MGLHGTVKSAYLGLGKAASNNRIKDWKWFFEQEVNSWNHWVSMPIRRRLWLWKHGFPSPYEELYDFETHDPEAYLSVLQRYRLYKSINGQHRYLLDDKLSQYWMLADYPENRPTAYGLIDKGYLHGLADTEFSGPPRKVSQWLPSALQERSKLVFKHLRGEGGKQVLVCEYDDGFIVDGEPVPEEVLCEKIRRLSGYLVTEYVNQNTYAEQLYPHAPNTIRILTIWDDEEQLLHTPMAVHRIGVERSRPIDNFSAGGLSAEIDLETGELGQAVQFPFDGELSWYSTHPDTGKQIAGEKVPNWKDVLSTIKQIARGNTNIPAIGWDVIIDKAGTPIIIEANTGTHLDVMQVHRPLLTDQRIARIASNHIPGIRSPGKSESQKMSASHR